MALGEEQRAEIERKGGVIMTVQDWLGLSDAEMQIIEFRVAMVKEVRRRRIAAKLSRKALAERMGVSPPIIAEIEAGTSASLETILMAFLATGATLADLGPILVVAPRSGEAQ